MSQTNQKAEHTGVFTRFVEWFSVWSVRWIPDAMVFVLLLTLVIYVLGLALTDHGPLQLINDWVKGFWALLTFAMQMSVLMITGFVLADSRPIRRAITKFVTSFKSARSAIICYALLIGVIWWLHWGIGLMVGIIMGRELAARNKGMGLHYPLVAAVSYCGIVLAGGPSQAPPLLIATPNHFIEKLTGVIPVTETILLPYMLTINVLLLLVFIGMFVLMIPPKHKAKEIPDELIGEFTAEIPDPPRENRTPAQIMDTSSIIPLIVAIFGLIWAVQHFGATGFAGLDLNSLNFLMLMLGMILHKNPYNFVASLGRGVGMVGGVIIQFPFYAGIFGIIQNSGMSGIIAGWFVSISTQHTFPIINYIYSAILNIFVPSGGSKFVIEAPYIIPAGKELGTPIAYVVNSYVLGDLTTNLIQPFWALPILGAFRIKFQQILPYGFILMVACALVIIPCLYFFQFIFPTPMY
ncbi:MAG: TIGR00366 family protein [Deltaproteobacteria bacterium]|jgi:short-chain fatty acids transporter|nr:TIGR00366 family protein [Deltaproteobacteria bacterium]